MDTAARDPSLDARAPDASKDDGTAPAGARIAPAVHRLGSALAAPVASLVVAGLIFGLFMIAVGHKTDFYTIRLIRNAQAGLARNLANLLFAITAHRKQ